MFRGILKTRSVDINNIQRIIDPLILSIIYCKVLNINSFFNLNFFLVFFVNLTILNLNKIYHSYRIRNLNNILPNIFSHSTLICLFAALLNIHKSSLTRFELISFFILCFLYLFFHHYILRIILRYLRSKGFNTRNGIFFGNKESFKLVINELEKYPWIGFKIKYWFSPNKGDYKVQDNNSFEHNCSGDINELVKKLNSESFDNLFFCHDENDELSFKCILKKFGDICIPVTYLIDWKINSISLKKEYLGDMVGLNIWNPVNSIINEKIKRLFDLVLGLFLLLIFSPFFIFISILIKFSSEGPIFFVQERYGLNGIAFKMYKFRTMYVSQNQASKLIIQAKKKDSRITRIGKFLRKYSLDELPQLINVIKGDMSLVGPRPHAVEHNEYYRKIITGYMQRHSKLPGMTGLAQIKGARGETSNVEMMKRRVDFDIDYNNNWSLFKDFLILIKTVFSVLKGKAY